MASLPRPLIALLVATLAGFGLWYVELKGGSSASGGSSQGLGAYQSAINKAHQAVKISGAANARLGDPTSTTPAPNSSTTAKSTSKSTSTSTSKSTAKSTAPAKTASATVPSKATPPAKTESTAQQVTLIRNALIAHQVVAVLFYNPAASDDVAVDHELAAVPTHGGQVVKLAVPVSELTNFAIITQQIPVVTAPTLVLVNSSRQATTITGFVDTLEISQRVDDALAAK